MYLILEILLLILATEMADEGGTRLNETFEIDTDDKGIEFDLPIESKIKIKIAINLNFYLQN